MDVKSVNIMLFKQELHDQAEFLLQITEQRKPWSIRSSSLASQVKKNKNKQQQQQKSQSDLILKFKLPEGSWKACRVRSVGLFISVASFADICR